MKGGGQSFVSATSALSLSHAPSLRQKLTQSHAGLSEYSFANIWLFRDLHGYKFEQAFPHCLRGVTRDGQEYFMVASKPSQEQLDVIWQILPPGVCLYPFPDAWLSRIDPHRCYWEFRPADSDYLFKIEKLQSYPGRHLDGHRNHVRQFLSSYQAEIAVAAPCLEGDAAKILEMWKQEQETLGDADACKEAWRHLGLLDLEGLVFYIRGEPMGFVLGEKQPPSSFLLHFAKGSKHIKGLYPYMYQQLAIWLGECSTSLDYIRWVNFEQDLGLPGLAKAKMSYKPDQLARKWRIWPR